MNESPKARVLVVEDEEASRVSIAEILTVKGFAVTAADNGTAALQCLSKENFDIMLVDYALPDITGIDVIKKSSQMSGHPVPIIITGMSSLEVALEGMRLGAHDYLVKPVNFEELAVCMGIIIKEREMLVQKKKNVTAALDAIPQRGEVIYDVFEDAASPDKPRMNDRPSNSSALNGLWEKLKRFLSRIY